MQYAKFLAASLFAALATTSAITTAAVISLSVPTGEPRAGADEYTVNEEIWSPVSIGGACVRGIRKVTVITNWRGSITVIVVVVIVVAVIIRSILGPRITCPKDANRQQRKIS